ncbi:MAG: hypothetical protein AAF288_08490 [Planctomycetota bacterium]
MTQQTETATDYEGRPIEVGDIVRTLGGEMTGTVREIASEDGEEFVRVRPTHMAAGKGVWHSADRLLFTKQGRKR